jgi:hypothetical protein
VCVKDNDNRSTNTFLHKFETSSVGKLVFAPSMAADALKEERVVSCVRGGEEDLAGFST